MDHCISGRRRHGLTHSEFGPVFRAVTEKLNRLVNAREDFPESEARARSYRTVIRTPIWVIGIE